MAESMLGLKRSHRCTEVTTANIGQEVTVMGWVQKSRNKGGIIFVDLRDRSGILQIIFEESDCGAESFAKAEKLRSEYVIAVTGRVEARSGAVNENLATGAIEVRANSLRILSESETPPFPIEENSKTKEELRLKYRFLDLRRPDMQRNLLLRSKIAILTRQFLAEEGFDENYGARPLRRAIQRMVEDSLSEELLSGQITLGDHLIAKVKDGKLAFDKAEKGQAAEEKTETENV